MDIIIRQATKADAAAFNEVIALCSQQLDEQGFSHWRYYYEPQKNAESSPTVQTFVAVYENKVIGCVCLDLGISSDFFKADYKVNLGNKSLAYITTLAVMPDFQNQGTGDKLMMFVEDIAKKENKLPIITMRYELKNLVDFYAKRNYIEIGRMIIAQDEQYSLLIKHQ